MCVSLNIINFKGPISEIIIRIYQNYIVVIKHFIHETFEWNGRT